ncbi:hypothetical protein Q8W71_06805 [Methylobacterium sp. NEAU 140]|uniref:hypothetical protein n=1 Tax=Methylobacterium sp. NEAU 140 TaxID=3064945 RepID=UPI002733D013|nr:hypothetical protein [Methylobacterium sp. NEAU 140]MDP4022326.1 hypothetical protein [Methylobacterium sp. NEAU 140]
MLDQATGPALLTLSLITGSIKPARFKAGGAIEIALLSTCVVSGALGVAGLFA